MGTWYPERLPQWGRALLTVAVWATVFAFRPWALNLTTVVVLFPLLLASLLFFLLEDLDVRHRIGRLRNGIVLYQGDLTFFDAEVVAPSSDGKHLMLGPWKVSELHPRGAALLAGVNDAMPPTKANIAFRDLQPEGGYRRGPSQPQDLTSNAVVSIRTHLLRALAGAALLGVPVCLFWNPIAGAFAALVGAVAPAFLAASPDPVPLHRINETLIQEVHGKELQIKPAEVAAIHIRGADKDWGTLWLRDGTSMRLTGHDALLKHLLADPRLFAEQTPTP